MKFISVSAVISGFSMTCWASYPASPIDNYGVIIPEWKVEVSPDGPIVILPGTIEEVHETLLELNPDWDIDYSAYFDTPRSTLAKRYDFSRDEYFCRDRWPECSADAIETGVNYLRGVPGAPVNGPGPGNCGRVSCSYDSAIWWCNDNATPKQLEHFSDIADGADFLLTKCEVDGKVSGQVFTPSSWNVIVRKDDC